MINNNSKKLLLIFPDFYCRENYMICLAALIDHRLQYTKKFMVMC